MESLGLNDFNEVMKSFVESRFFVITLWLIGTFVLANFIKKIAFNKIKDPSSYRTVKQIINYFTAFVMIVTLIYGFLHSATNITTYIGLLSAGVAIALKELFLNIAGWVYIEIKRPFEIGNRIKIENQSGDVIDKKLFQFTLLEISSPTEGEQSTGKIIQVPNSFIFSYPSINYSKGYSYVWNEISVVLTYDSDWRLAKEKYLQVLEKDNEKVKTRINDQVIDVKKQYQILSGKITPIVYTQVNDNGILLTLRYLCEPKQRRTTMNQIWEDILTISEEYPQIKISYLNRRF